MGGGLSPFGDEGEGEIEKAAYTGSSVQCVDNRVQGQLIVRLCPDDQISVMRADAAITTFTAFVSMIARALVW